VKRTKIFVALGCALLAIGLVGCGQSNNLQSIQVTAALVNGIPPTSQSGFVTLEGNGGTIQLAVTGEYSNGKTKNLTNEATYSVVVDPEYNTDAFGNTLVPPCTPGTCPNPGAPPPYASGTVQYNQTGLITAVEPATCTWVDASSNLQGVVQPPSWFYTGDYVVTVTFEGVTSQPFFVPVASSAGNPNNPALDTGSNPTGGVNNNPTEQCGPTPTS